MPKLYLRVLSDALPKTEDEGFDLNVEWLITENDGTLRSHGVADQRGLEDVADPNIDWLMDPVNTTVFVPSDFVLRIACEVPGRSQGQIRRTLPFAVEEFVASDIEHMHIAHGAIKPGIPIQCNVLAREQIENWITCFKAIGVHAGAMVAEAEVLSQVPTEATLVFDNKSVLVSHKDQTAVIARESLGNTLAALEIKKIVALNGTPTELEIGQVEGNVDVDEIAFNEGGLLRYLAECHRVCTTYINLLQGEYRPERRRNEVNARWKQVAGLAAAWALIGFVSLLVQGWWASSEAGRLEAEIFAFYERVFPEESQPVSVDQLRRRMTTKLGASTASGDLNSEFIGLMAHFAKTAKPGHDLLSLSYTEQRRELTVEVLLKDYNELDIYKQTLVDKGIEVETTSAEQEERGIRSRMRFRYAR
ncbi:MAG: type II secretion system protein GspL [Pseudomonadota bacterium]|nr:type II secretion system protein GspL [Pseudomonadota bacterium]